MLIMAQDIRQGDVIEGSYVAQITIGGHAVDQGDYIEQVDIVIIRLNNGYRANFEPTELVTVDRLGYQ